MKTTESMVKFETKAPKKTIETIVRFETMARSIAIETMVTYFINWLIGERSCGRVWAFLYILLSWCLLQHYTTIVQSVVYTVIKSL